MNPLNNLHYELKSNRASDILTAKQLADQALKDPSARHEYFNFLKSLRDKKGPEYSTAVHQYASKLMQTKKPDIYPVEEDSQVNERVSDSAAIDNAQDRVDAHEERLSARGYTRSKDPTSNSEYQFIWTKPSAKLVHVVNYRYGTKGFPASWTRPANIEETIVKTDGQYELKSKSGKNLGKYPSKAGAEKRERQVNYFKHANEDTNPTDTITVDVPLLIRLLEYAREDAKTDMDLHNVTEKLIELSAQGKTLSMQDYNTIVGTN